MHRWGGGEGGREGGRGRGTTQQCPQGFLTYGWSPSSDFCVGAGPVQVNGGIRSKRVVGAVVRHFLFVGAPTEFSRLAPFADKAVHRPSVDKFARLLWVAYNVCGVVPSVVPAVVSG